MNTVAVGLVAGLLVVSSAASGLVLLGTRARLAGVGLLAAAVGIALTALVGATGHDELAWHLGGAVVLLPASFAVLAYPQPRTDHWVEFCAWATAGGAGVLATALVSFDGAVAVTLAIVGAVALLGHGWWVLECGDDLDQEPILWLGLAALVTALASMVLPFAFGVAVAVGIPAATIPPAMAIGIRRPRLIDIRASVVAAVVLTVVAVTYVSVFIAVGVALAPLGVDDPGPPTYAVIGLILAAGVHPLWVVLRGLVDELLFGDRPDPLSAATTVADRIGDDPLLALRAIREALVLPYAAIVVDGEELAASGTLVTDARRLPLSGGDASVGEIVVGLRPGELALSPDDVQVLRIVGPLLAQTLRARALALDLQQSRSAAITAIEEERRRLRRDLHDGLGPTLSGIAHTAAAARNTMGFDPAGADALLRGLRTDAKEAVAEIRRLVYDMRPPALDELGLVAALRQQLRGTRTPTGAPVDVVIDAGELPALRASVEVAAYRIATEAVTNSARHSGGDQVRLSIVHDERELVLTVCDAGRSAGEWVPGVGVASMRERAAEVGGSLDIVAKADGAAVLARLPLDAATSATA